MSLATRKAIDPASQPQVPASAADGDATTPSRPTAAARRPSKAAMVVRLLRRKRGATLAELQAATGWQAHSVRGFLSGTVRKRMKLTLTAEAGADGVRRYQIAAAAANASPASEKLDPAAGGAR